MNIFESVAQKYAECKAVIVGYVRRAEAEMKGKSGAEKRAYVVKTLDDSVKLPWLIDDVLNLDGIVIGMLVDRICNALNILTDHGDWSAITVSDETIAAVSEIKEAEIEDFEDAHYHEDVDSKIKQLCERYGIEAEPDISNEQMSRDFNRSEFACKCGCGYNFINPALVNMLQTIRDAMGEPITVNSGCRCEKHNKKVGGVDNSYHVQGMAADITCKSGASKLFSVIKTLRADGRLPILSFCQYYQSKNFVHVDIGKPRNAVFSVKG